ncbi:MAG: diacylglycerol kinase family lipid kinase [Sedimentisphaerales bacterium]|nr:diacylglycerol kinase family lipid kinase [Sedimentisphaerales bacterium]
MGTNIIIANKKARWGLNRSRVRRAEAFLDKNKFAFSSYTTDYPGHALEIAAQATIQKVDIIVVIGGDGTLNEVINGVLAAGCSQIPCIGIIPTGSSNDFSKSLGLPQRLDKACLAIINGNTKYVDIGQAAGHYFCMASSVGLFAAVCAESYRMKGLSGSLRYIAAALGIIRKMSSGWEMNIKAGERIFRGTYGTLLVSNTPRYGGLTFIPEARPDDGLLDCMLIEMPKKLEALSLIPLVLGKALVSHNKVTMFQAQSLSVSLTPSAPLSNDGEVYPHLFSSVDYKILPQKLQIFC